jgi:hypothetical protein
MLGRMRLQTRAKINGLVNGNSNSNGLSAQASLDRFDHVDWVDPNKENLVAEGRLLADYKTADMANGTQYLYPHQSYIGHRQSLP